MRTIASNATALRNLPIAGMFVPVVAENQPGKKNRMHSDLCEIAASVGALIEGRGVIPFEELALALFMAQRARNAAYAKLCAARNVGQIERWEEIPAVPTVAFKELELTSVPIDKRVGVFFSSGTTKQERSRHFHSAESLELYEASLRSWFTGFFGGELNGVHIVSLTPMAKDAPNSSLAYMFSRIAADFVGEVCDDGGWELDFARAVEVLQRAGRPVALMGTAFLFVHLLDEMGRSGTRLKLPEGSWVLETGGYKGRTREIPKEELHRLLKERLGVARVFGEYGMSELSSQAYAGEDGLFRFPRWARVQIISPATGREAREGERGLIRVYDLANVWSVMAVQTEDIGIKVGDAFRLVGRAASAEARGCSLMSV